MGISVHYVSKKRGYPSDPKMPMGQRFKTFLAAIPSLMTVVIIIGGIWGGLFTATEAAAVASLYALILGTVIYKNLDLKGVINVIKESMYQSCKTLFIIAVANFLTYFIQHQRVADMIIEGLMGLTTNRYILIFIIIFILLILGCFVEGTAVILIAAPIFMPLVTNLGMDLVQFGVVMILASMIGLLTPPVGMSLYAVSSITNVSVIELSKEVIPYLIGIFFVLLLCAFTPIATFLPSLLL